MSDKVIKCNSCGFPLEASAASHNRIKCPKCGVVNVIETAKSPSDSDEAIVGGFQLTAGGAAIHKGIVAWIIANYETAPTDVFEHLRLTSVERICVPCYLFECNATIRYSYEVGNQRERVRRIGDDDDYTERYTEYTHHNDAYEFSGSVLVSENDLFAKPIQSLYENLTFSDVVDLESLKYPSDVKQQFSNVTFPKAQAEVKTIVGNRAQEGVKKILERTDHKDLQIRNDYHVEYDSTPKRILAPLIHVTFSYKDKTGDFWLTGDATRVIVDNFPLNYEYQNTQLSLKKKLYSGCSGCGIVLLLIPLIIGDLFVSIQMAGGIAGVFISNAFIFSLTCLGMYLKSRSDKESKRFSSELESLTQEHNNIYAQFIKGQIPLHGVWEKSLRGKPEAFPENVIRTQLNITSIGDRKSEVIRITSQSANLSLQDAEAFFAKGPVTITCDSDAEADRIQKELESVGATVTRTYILSDIINNS